jgi:hypothetical protein
MRPLPVDVDIFLGGYETRQSPIERMRALRRAIAQSQARLAASVFHALQNTKRGAA